MIVIVHPLNLFGKPVSFVQSNRTFQNIFLILGHNSTAVNADDEDCDCPPLDSLSKMIFLRGVDIRKPSKKDFFEAVPYDDDDNDF